MPPEVPPVISKFYDLVLSLLDQIPKFPRSHRFVLGDQVQCLILDIIDLLIEAAYSREKVEFLRRPGIHS